MQSAQKEQEEMKSRQPKQRRQLIGAIDQGTSSTRFLVFESGTGQLIASSQKEIERIVPKEGWVEIDPNKIMDSVYSTINNVHEQLTANTSLDSPIRASTKLKCIGICNQRESTVVWDSKTGKALYNVIVWMDNRTKDLVDDLIDSVPGRDFNWLKDKTGLPMSTYFSAFKLKWLIDNVEEVKLALKENRLLFGTVDSWILWNLTGQHLTDVTNASRTFLMDIESLEWDKTLCKYFNVPINILPKIQSSADNFGYVQHGPLKGLPITGVIGDQSAALFGHNCLQMGQTKATFGTGCFIMQNIGPGPLNGALSGVQREAKRGLITTVGYKLKDKPASYALEGSVKIAGAGLTWLRDNMQLIKDYDECDKLVNMTSHSAGVFFVPALGGLYSPYWDPNAAGLYIGLSQFSRREHLVRATFDAIAFQTNDILSLMRGVTNGLMIDGGLCKSDNMCQILADITGCDIVRPSMCETSALGAAMVAGCGADIWPYEEMLSNSNTPYEYSSSCNQNHHYPQQSLHYEDKFSSLIHSKSFPAPKVTKSQQVNSGQGLVATRTSVCNLDAGGGINDDAGGGRTSPTITGTSGQLNILRDDADSTSSQLTNSSTELDDAGVTTSGEFTTNSSEPGVGDLPTVIPTTNHHHLSIGQKVRHHATPSSGYSSGDNFDLTTTNSADPMRSRDSPISSIQFTESLTSADCNDQRFSSHSVTLKQQQQQQQQQQNEESVKNPSSSSSSSSFNVNLEQTNGDQQLLTTTTSTTNRETTTSDEARSKTGSYISQTFPFNLSTCLRNYICPSSTNDDQNLAGEFGDDDECDGEESEGEDLYVQEMDYKSITSADSFNNNRCMITKPTDVFQSYISLEHRTELVNTWRLAVERSMQWTKIHHEEIRRIDYQRLSSLPISMYLFFSIGLVALSGLFSAARGGGIMST